MEFLREGSTIASAPKEFGMGVIYMVTNNITGMQYIGQTRLKFKVRRNRHLRDARIGSETVFHRAIRKYGEENFSWAVIAIAPIAKLDEIEKEYIQRYGTQAPGGYNITPGGVGVGTLPRESLDRMASKNRGKKRTAEERARMSAARRLEWARRTPEQRQELVNKRVAARKGKRPSPETIQKIRASNQRRWANATPEMRAAASIQGKRSKGSLSEEGRQRMREAGKKRAAEGWSAKMRARRKLKAVRATNLETYDVLEFPSRAAAADYLGICRSHLGQVLKGMYKTNVCKGWKLEYLSEDGLAI